MLFRSIENIYEATQFCLNPIPTKNKNHFDRKIIDREKQLKQFFTEAFVKNDLNWWSKKFKNLENKISTGKNEDEKFMNIRLKNFLSLAAYSYSNSALNNNRIPEADKFLNIYKLVDPKNSEHAYLRTKYFMIINKTEDAAQALNEAATLGFNDAERLRNEQLFIPLQNSDGYKKIMQQDRKSTRLNSSHIPLSRMPSSA